VNCNNTGKLTAAVNMPILARCQDAWRFSRETRESFGEREIQSKVCFLAKIIKKIYFFIKKLQL
jgi:hypothetical protein